jgi:hypothetical protein
MIAGLSKAVTLYLAPILSLTAILLSLFAFLAPAVMLHDRVSLLSVTPSSALTQPRGSSKGIDGPSLFLGALGSCSKNDNKGDITCTIPSLSPIYDTHALPGNAPKLLLSAPTASTPGFIATALVFSILFFFTFTLISFRHKLGKASATFDKPVVQRLNAWMGVFGFIVGLVSFLILRMWFGKAADDFNNDIQNQGSKGPQLVANTGNGFTMIWVAYAFYGVPVVVSLAKLNVQATKTA